MLRHHSHLCLRVSWEESKLSPVQSISFLSMELESVNMMVCLTDEGAQSVLKWLNLFRVKSTVLLKQFQRLLGHMASTAIIMPLRLIHIIPLQHRLHSEFQDIDHYISLLPLTQPMVRLCFSSAGVPLEVSRHAIVTTDASRKGWGAVCNGTQLQAPGHDLICTGISIASSC